MGIFIYEMGIFLKRIFCLKGKGLKEICKLLILLLHTGTFKKFSSKFCFLLKKKKKVFQVTFFREGEISYDIPYRWNLKRNDTKNLLTRQRPTAFENDLMVARGKE